MNNVKIIILSFMLILSASKVSKDISIAKRLPAATLQQTQTSPLGLKKKNTSLYKSKEIYQKMAAYPNTSTPAQTGASDNIQDKFNNISTDLMLDQSKSYKLSMSKAYYSKDEVIIFYIESPEKEIKSMDKIKAVLKITNQEIKLEQINNHKYTGTLKDLEQGNYTILIGTQTTRSLLSFAVRENYYNFQEVSENFITSNGNLKFILKFDILKSENYILEGSLFYKNKLIGFAEKIHTLNKSNNQLVDLEFFGKIISDQEIDGQLELRNITLSPIKKDLRTININLISPKYTTERYSFDQFNSHSFNNRVLVDKIKIISNYQ
jgi:hypothetical protein